MTWAFPIVCSPVSVFCVRVESFVLDYQTGQLIHLGRKKCIDPEIDMHQNHVLHTIKYRTIKVCQLMHLGGRGGGLSAPVHVYVVPDTVRSCTLWVGASPGGRHSCNVRIQSAQNLLDTALCHYCQVQCSFIL